MQISRSNKGIIVNQRKYALDLLNENSLLGIKPSPILMEQGYETITYTYRRLVGYLIYLTVTQPNIKYSVIKWWIWAHYNSGIGNREARLFISFIPKNTVYKLVEFSSIN